MNTRFDPLISRANAGSIEAVKTLSNLCAGDTIVFCRRVVPVFLKHIQHVPPSLDIPEFLDGSIPSLSTVTLAIHCIDRLSRAFDTLQNQGRERTEIVGLVRGLAAHTTAHWPKIYQWIAFFSHCLDLHRQTTTVIPEYQDLYRVMFSGSSGILAGMAESSDIVDVESACQFLGTVPRYMDVLFGLAILPSHHLVTEQAWLDLAHPLIQFASSSHIPAIQDEVCDAMLRCMKSPGAFGSFQDRIAVTMNNSSMPELYGLMGYISIPFNIAVHPVPRSYPARQTFFSCGMVRVTAKALAIAQDTRFLTDTTSTGFISQCSSYILWTVSDEGYQAVLDALKGSLGILFSISRAAQVLFGTDFTESWKHHSSRVIKDYVDILNEVTKYLIHPTVLRNCSRHLRKHALLLTTEDSRFRPLVTAGKDLLNAVALLQSRRIDYKNQAHPTLCSNSECPLPGVTLSSLKFCTACLTTTYCSRDCQKSDWNLHKTKCNSLAAERYRHRDNRSFGISLPHYLHYLCWNMRVDAERLIAPKGPLVAPNGSASFKGYIIELDYTSYPVKGLVISIADFLSRPVNFPENQAYIEAEIEQGGLGPFIYMVVPNAQVASHLLFQLAPNFFQLLPPKPNAIFRVTLAASLLLFSVSAIPVPAGQYYYDPVREASSSNIDSHPPTYNAYPPSVLPPAPQVQPSTPDSPARAPGKRPSKRQRSPNDGGSPSSQSQAKEIKGPQLSDKPFACKEAGCGKRYKLQGDLTRHYKGHTDATKYKCDHPGCTYPGAARQDKLTDHKRTHDPDRPRVAKRFHSEEKANWTATCSSTHPVQKNVTHAAIAIPHSPGKTS
ncbi:hypothetical protein C8J56DRAFT_1065692 [Mycena floridula]|nr:hypothetical protein C8J56DRAFT_1065692 [Mycena floridula]